MAESQFVTPEVLRQLRRGEDLKMAAIRRNQLSGVDYASAELGNALGGLIRQGMTRAGILKDPEMEKAQRLQSGIEWAQRKSEGPDRPEDPIAASIFERQNLLEELQAMGMSREADAVRAQIMDLRKQELEFQKLQGDIDAQEALRRKRQLEGDYLEETYDDRVESQRIERMHRSFNYQTDWSLGPYRIAEKRADLEARLADNKHNAAIRPFVLSRAQSDAQIRQLEAQYGGPLPDLNQLQLRRDALAVRLLDDPNNPFVQQNFQELEAAIQTRIMNVQRNVDNFEPTQSMLSRQQADALALDGINFQIDQLIQGLEGNEPFGATADMRRKAGGFINQGLTLLGMNETGNRLNEIIFSEDEQKVRAQARILHTDIMNWLKGNSRATPQESEQAHNLLQALLEPEVQAKAVVVSLLEFQKWAGQRQINAWNFAEQGMRGITDPRRPPIEESEEDRTTREAFESVFSSGGSF